MRPAKKHEGQATQRQGEIVEFWTTLGPIMDNIS